MEFLFVCILLYCGTVLLYAWLFKKVNKYLKFLFQFIPAMIFILIYKVSGDPETLNLFFPFIPVFFIIGALIKLPVLWIFSTLGVSFVIISNVALLLS